MLPNEIEANVSKFLSERDASARNASFDYCFNYFQTARERGEISALANDENLEKSCLHLGFYLASWGMLRGSSFLLKGSSLAVFKRVIEAIANAEPLIWELDVDKYEAPAIEAILDFGKRLAIAFHPHETRVTDALKTKIVLGVFGNVPAFDSFFTGAFRAANSNKRVGFNRTALENVARFYNDHQSAIDSWCDRTTTLDFSKGETTSRHYTRGKVIDMIFFQQGFDDANNGPIPNEPDEVFSNQ
ncbi:MAG: hypothetical protein ACYDBJ_05405 [Aggregatilineales bacterium]